MPVEIPTLTTRRLLLRGLTYQDVDPLYRILSVPGMLRYFPKAKPPSRDRVEKLVARQLEHWEEHGYGWWAVEHRPQSALLAGVDFNTC